MKKRKIGCLIPVIIVIAFFVALIKIMLSVGVGSNDVQPTSEKNEINLIENVEQYSRISTDKLKEIMGEPSSEEKWMNGDYEMTNYLYDKNNNHYEFVIADNTVVRLSIYSEQYWNNKGDRFELPTNKENICDLYGVSITDTTKRKTDNSHTYTLSPVNEKIAMFDVQDIDDSSYGFVKITYNINYFDE